MSETILILFFILLILVSGILLVYLIKKEKLIPPFFESKIKNIYIELHNYSFFHSPTGLGKTYNKFVGRERLLERLRTLLTNSETKSGAYLITGFRGMGKTSLVRKVLSEIKGNHYYSLSRHFRLFLFLILIYIIRYKVVDNWKMVDENINLFVSISNVIFVLTCLYLIFHDRTRPNLFSYYKRKSRAWPIRFLIEGFYSFTRIYDTEFEYFRRSRFKVFLQDYAIIFSQFHLFVLISSPIEAKWNDTKNLKMLVIISIVYFLLIFVYNNYQIEFRKDFKRHPIKLLGSGLKRIFVNAIKRIDYGNKVSIEISLSQDDLKEIDILKLLSKNIYSEYKILRHRWIAPNRLVLPIIYFIGIYAICGLLFYYKPIYKSINEFRKQSGIYDYLPSQAILPSQGNILAVKKKMIRLEDSYKMKDFTNDINQLIIRNHLPSERTLINQASYIEISKLFDNIIRQASVRPHPENDADVLIQHSVQNIINLIENNEMLIELTSLNSSDYNSSFDYKNLPSYIFEINKLIEPNNKASGKGSIVPSLQDNFKQTLNCIDTSFGLNYIDSTNMDAVNLNNISKKDKKKLKEYRYILASLKHQYDYDSIQVANQAYIDSLNNLLLTFRINKSLFNNQDYLVSKTDALKKTFTNNFKPISIVKASDQTSMFKKFTRTIDYFLFVFYQKTFGEMREGYKRYAERISVDLVFPPATLDYFFILFIFLFSLLFGLVFNNSWRIGIMNHRYILKRLRNLNENIGAQIIHDQKRGVETSGLNAVFNIFTRKVKTTPIAGVREIENELIDILKEIDQIPSISTRPEFIFIFDELDKIEANYNVNIIEREQEELTNFNKGEEGYFSTESIRKRQEAIARILGNLKLFFNTAKAKFIFIAGREMYDAALADISDRESFISSIFHEIIYVDSFFKDPVNNKYAGITGLTERFVCQLLLPANSKYNRDISGYEKYLKNEFLTPKNPLWKLMARINRYSNAEIFTLQYNTDKQLKLERQKVIYTIQQFITFLTYRSNGAPKKITKLLESFIRQVDVKELKSPNNLLIGRNSKNLFLYLNYTDQYRIGLTHQLFKPFLVANRRHYKDLGDKLLIATSFLVDHLYKYHDVGFSWINLELTPEIIAINKSPGLRKFISEIINFLSNTHIESIVNGLYQFKFNKRVTNEIRYISKISELESAAFNFTLDESLLSKRHYRKKLKSLKTENAKLIENEAFNNTKSLSYIQTILGDLHFYDREYDEALIQYMDARQLISGSTSIDISMKDFLQTIYLNLKIGLTYEKMRAFDQAFVTFGSLTKLLRTYGGYQYVYSGYSISSSFDEPVSKKANEKFITKKLLFENIRLVYQPTIALLHIIEKGSPNRITNVDLEHAKKEFKLITYQLESVEKFLIQTEFFNKLGDITYYKNGKIITKGAKGENGFKAWQNWLNTDLFSLPVKLEDSERDYVAPITALKFYLQGIETFANGIKRLINFKSPSNNSNFQHNHNVLLTLYYLKHSIKSPEKLLKKTIGLFTTVAGNLSDLADSIICTLHNSEDQVLALDICQLIPGLEENSYSATKKNPFDGGIIIEIMIDYWKNHKPNKSNNPDIVIFLYLLSSQYYLKAGNYYKYTALLKKILNFVKRYLELNTNYKNRLLNKNVWPFSKLLYRQILNNIDRSWDYTRRQNLFENEVKLNATFNSLEKKELYVDSHFANPESKELIILIEEIDLLVNSFSLEQLLEKLEEQRLITPFSIIDNKFNRIYELSYKCNLNFRIAGELKIHNLSKDKAELDSIFNEINVNLFNVGYSDDLLIYLITDSIVCLSEIIKTYKTFGIDYTNNHSLLAISHEHMGNWCYYLKQLESLSNSIISNALKKRLKKMVDSIETRLELLIGKSDLMYLEAGYHYNLALLNFYKTLEMHSEGPAYENAINEMFYLDDDFDDDLYHFCAAIERYRINTGYIRKRIDTMKTKINAVDRYKADTFTDRDDIYL